MSAGKGKHVRKVGAWDVGFRTALAIFGGYLAAAIAAMVMARTLPLEKADATSLATLLSFIPYTCAVLWVFAARTPLRAAIFLAAPTVAAWAALRLMPGAAS